MVVFLAVKVHLISLFLAEVTLQSFPSTVTVLFEALGEKPEPVMVRYWPPMFPLAGETLSTLGRELYSKY